MLLGVGRHRFLAESSGDTVHNYYEHVIYDRIHQMSDRANTDDDFFADVACVALNRLPPRYVRYDVDMSFFMTPVERDEMSRCVTTAVEEAIEYVESHQQGNPDIQ